MSGSFLWEQQVQRLAREDVVGPAPRPTTLPYWKGYAMARNLIAISVVTITVLVTAFGITMAVSYAINERCTDQMARDGNC